MLGSIDLEQFIEETFTSVKDWDDNFKTGLTKRRELDRLQDFYKVDCFNISITSLKGTIEDQLQKLTDSLVVSLKQRIKKDKSTVDKFLEEGMAKLTSKPETVEEIGAAKVEALEIAKSKAGIRELYQECQEKNKLLRQMAGQNVDLTEIESRWTKLETTLSAFSEMIEEQKNVVKSEIDQRIRNVNVEIEKFYARWSALKPKEMDEMDNEIAEETTVKMKDWRKEWDIIEKKIKDSITDCEHFQMAAPSFSFQKEVSTTQSHTLNPSWIRFRKN